MIRIYRRYRIRIPIERIRKLDDGSETAHIATLHAQGFVKTGIPREPWGLHAVEALRMWSSSTDTNKRMKAASTLAHIGWFQPPPSWEEACERQWEAKMEASRGRIRLKVRLIK